MTQPATPYHNNRRDNLTVGRQFWNEDIHLIMMTSRLTELRTAVEVATSDRERLDALLVFGRELLYYDPQQSLGLAGESLELAERLEDQQSMARVSMPEHWNSIAPGLRLRKKQVIISTLPQQRETWAMPRSGSVIMQQRCSTISWRLCVQKN